MFTFNQKALPVTTVKHFDPFEIRDLLFNQCFGGVIVREDLPHTLEAQLSGMSNGSVIELRNTFRRFVREKSPSYSLECGGLEDIWRQDQMRLKSIFESDKKVVTIVFDERLLPNHVDLCEPNQVQIHRHYWGAGMIIVSPRASFEITVTEMGKNLVVLQKEIDRLRKMGVEELVLNSGDSVYFGSQMVHRSNPKGEVNIRTLTL